MTPGEHLEWLHRLAAQEGGIKRAGVRSGSNQAIRSRRDRRQRVIVSSSSFTVRGGQRIDQRAILDATASGVDEELGRALK